MPLNMPLNTAVNTPSKIPLTYRSTPQDCEPRSQTEAADGLACVSRAETARLPQVNSRGVIMVVDDEPTSRALITRWLERDGFEVESFETAEACLAAFAHTIPDAICLDLELPGMNGIEALGAIAERAPHLPTVVLTATREVETVVRAMQAGAYDYIAKPPEREKLAGLMQRAVEKHRAARSVVHTGNEASRAHAGRMLGQSPVMKRFFGELDRVAMSDITVLVHGESGTGKELVAQALAEQSARNGAPFISLNCAAIPESLQESEFFGHEKGAFTGALAMRKGRFELAHGGTLFLDEVAELSLPLQAKLLRVLQEKTFQRVGGNQVIRSDFRLVAATHRDLSALVVAGTFRQDFFLRLALFELDVPPLRAREGDVLLLAQKFLSDYAGGRSFRLAPETSAVMQSYLWPGNVRELQNAMQRAVVVCEDGVVRLSHLPPKVREPSAKEASVAVVTADPFTQTPDPAKVAVASPSSPAVSPVTSPERDLRISALEKQALEDALARCGGNVSEAVKQLGIGRTTIYRMMKRHGIRQ
jgi:DNA-binding NtrC family response regulator